MEERVLIRRPETGQLVSTLFHWEEVAQRRAERNPEADADYDWKRRASAS
jgi:hypothetical protein